MIQIHDRIDRLLEVIGEVHLHGLAARGVAVRPGGTLHLHGTCVGDLRIDPGGRAFVPGVVTGHAFNSGELIIGGVVGYTVRTLESGQTTLWADSRVARGGFYVQRITEDEDRVAAVEDRNRPFATRKTSKAATGNASPVVLEVGV